MTVRQRDTMRGEATLRGFTIVELLIVIVVIAILAAITIVAYNGITNRAIETSMQSDLQHSATSLELDNLQAGAYPASAAAANGGQGLKASGSNVQTYQMKPYGYCVSVSNPRTAKTFVLKSATGQTAEGNCNLSIATFAGSDSGTSGSDDGTASAARFNLPGDVAIDGAGTVYVADTYNHRIRKIAPNGDVTTLAGSGSQGFLDATGTAAQFAHPHSVVVDAAGNVYVTDTGNARIRKVSPAGVVTTFAGSSSGYVDGTGVGAQFDSPKGLTIDASGTLYVADERNSRIRKTTPAGVVTTLAGSGVEGFADGPSATAQFDWPTDVAVDNSGSVLVIDGENSRVRKVSPTGTVTTLAGSGVTGYLDGPAATAQFSEMVGIAADSYGNAYVTEHTTQRVRLISQAGVVSTISSWGWGTALRGIVVNPTADAFYVADQWGHRIRKVTQ